MTHAGRLAALDASRPAVAVLNATAFTLVMSNVGATVPAGAAGGVDRGGGGRRPGAVCPDRGGLHLQLVSSPSRHHQANALIMGPAGYKVKDFVKSGGIMTVIFLVVSLVMLNVVF